VKANDEQPPGVKANDEQPPGVKANDEQTRQAVEAKRAMRNRRSDPLRRPKAWLVTGPLGRGLAFAIDFAVAVRRGLLRRSP
jgi:hypothetical protein